MKHTLLPPHRPKPEHPLIGDLGLACMRVHEFCGPARRTLALMAAHRGPVFWIQCHWQVDRLFAPGVLPYFDPGQITFVRPKRLEDVLWCMEEVLRAGCVPLVIAELPAPPHLTPIRRLHLAAEAGAQQRKVTPLALLLTPGDGGAQGVESRWHLAPRHEIGQSGWLLQRRRARMAPPAAWAIDWNKDGAVLGAQVRKGGSPAPFA